jgi:hypothetical protein
LYILYSILHANNASIKISVARKIFQLQKFGPNIFNIETRNAYFLKLTFNNFLVKMYILTIQKSIYKRKEFKFKLIHLEFVHPL